MYQSNRSFNIHPPGNPPRHLNFWRLACSNSLPSGQKSRSNAPPITSEIPLLKDKFRLQSNTVHTFQLEMCRDDTFRLLLKTLLKELFTNKGEILSCKSIRPCKNRKNSQEDYTRTRDKSGSNSLPFQGNIQIPPSRAPCTVKCPGYARGVDVKLQFDRYAMTYQIPYFSDLSTWPMYCPLNFTSLNT